MSIKLQIRLFLSWLASVYMLAAGPAVNAAEMVLAASPLFLGTQIDPNIFFMLDDSGSMDWEITTQDYNYYLDYWSNDNSPYGLVSSGNFRGNSSSGSCTSTRNFRYVYNNVTNTDNKYNSCTYAELEDGPNAQVKDWRVMTADMNITYYNPSATYSPWTDFSDASFTAARSNPQSGTDGYSDTNDMTGFEYHVWIDDHGYDGDGNGRIDGPDFATDGANEEVDLWDSHTKYVVNSTSVSTELLQTATDIEDINVECNSDDSIDSPPYKDCFGTTSSTGTISGATEDPWGRTYTEVQQNVANWFQYHRRRSFVMKAAISRVVSSNTSFRFGLSLLNEYALVFEQVPAEEVEEFDVHNAAILQSLYDFEWQSNGTPLQRGLERVGRYYSDYSGYSYDDPIISACQQNYSVLFTDGYWSNNNNPYEANITDEDDDGVSDTVADVAHYFYNTDLSSLPDDVPTTTLDQNEAQHMVTFTVAFGVEGNLVDTDDDRYPDPELEEDGAWHNGTVNTDAEKIDDLWHAAFNSKGYFVSAQSSEGVANAIAEALLEIADRVGSSASVATNTGSLNAGSKLFQARFDSSDWKGQLLAFEINLDGSISGNPDWEAGSRLNDQDYDTGREIITWNAEADVIAGGDPEGQGIPFRFPADYTSPDALVEFNDDQINALMVNAPYPVGTSAAGEISSNQDFGEAISDYLRGDDTNEGVGEEFRLRNSILGDIVNSDPKFVDVATGRYADDMEVKSFDDFVTDSQSRDGVVYAGANDGMLHAFSEDTGDELFAYIPNAVFDNLYELATDDYIHRYFVDAGPNIVDVFMESMSDPDSATNGLWRTALVGGLNGGGQGVYALDISDPTQFNESTASNVTLWEFNDTDDADLGYTYGRPQLAKMQNGKWAAIFGNGYNNTEADGNASTTGHAVLYIVDVETGALIKKFDTEAGSATTPNGLATPLLVDEDGNFEVDYIYAGDLLGNMWKFDVNDASTSSWDVAWSSGGAPAPLFTAPTGQQITSQPQASFHPDNLGGFMIFFGTGKYLETTDNDSISQTTQAFYGVWDKDENTAPSITASDLLDQTIDNQYTQAFDTDDDGLTDETFTLRDVSDNVISWSSHLGWALDLIPVKVENVSNTNNFGERQVSNAIVRNGRVIFTSLVPSSVECEFGGLSFLMELDFRDGSALEFPAFDLNGDGEYDADDTSASGRASDVGIMPTVSILADGAQDIAFGSGASGDIDVIQLSIGSEAYGRQSWRQLE